MPFVVVAFDADAVRAAPSPPADVGVARLVALAAGVGPRRADMILPGDTLSVSVFKVGVSLFGTVPPSASATRTPTTAAQVLTIEVREDGVVSLPYLGQIKAAGSYPEDLAAVIRQHLKSYYESPTSVSVSPPR